MFRKERMAAILQMPERSTGIVKNCNHLFLSKCLLISAKSKLLLPVVMVPPQMLNASNFLLAQLSNKELILLMEKLLLIGALFGTLFCSHNGSNSKNMMTIQKVEKKGKKEGKKFVVFKKSSAHAELEMESPEMPF